MMKRFTAFLRLETAPGLCLMAAAVLAMAVANSPLGVHYTALLDRPLNVGIGALALEKPVFLWINDGLMAVFFLVVGCELKREVLEGHLSSVKQAAFPAFAAAGGMLAPAACYAAFNGSDPVALKAWAIPTATDIAFALGVLALLGTRVPAGLRAFLLSVAIFDDLGAIVVIALFYSAGLSVVSLAVAAGLIIVLACLNRFGVTRLWIYLLVAAPLWVAVLKSGVHATLAGVLVAMFIPLGARESPLRRLEHALHPWVAFGVLPVFAFANAGVPIGGLSFSDVLHRVPLGIVMGLFAGKQAGILGLCGLATWLGLASPPQGVGWRLLHGTSLLCGIGFTMSLFIASLAFEQGGASFLGLEKLGILIGSLVCGVLGYAALRTGLPKETP